MIPDLVTLIQFQAELLPAAVIPVLHHAVFVPTILLALPI